MLTLTHTELAQTGPEGHSALVLEEEALERKEPDLRSLLVLCYEGRYFSYR